MAYKLVVTIPFGPYATGQEITDAQMVKAVAASNPAHVVRVAIPDPEPEPSKAKADPLN